MACLSRWEREYIVSGVNEDFRTDGRSCKDYRNFTLETGVVSNTSGSAKIKLVSMQITAPCDCRFENAHSSQY